MDSKALPPGWRLVTLPEVDSTNEEVKRRESADPGEGLVVTAAIQTAGRGRRGRPWNSPAGNLYVSIRLSIGDDLASAARLSFVAAVALVDALKATAPHLSVGLKWPNDVLVNGSKVSGILLESHNGSIILGVGVNLISAPEPGSTPYPATSLRAEGADIGRDDLLRIFLGELFKMVGLWRTGGFAPVRLAWLARACGIGKPVVARLQNGEEATGTFADLDDEGALVIEGAFGTRRILAGDVFFPHPTAPASR